MTPEIPIDKVPPQNLEAEMAVLGSMLLDENALSEAVEKLDKEHFYKDAHKKVFDSIRSLYGANKARHHHRYQRA